MDTSDAPMTTSDVLRRLTESVDGATVSYRQLDYVARTTPEGDLGGARGSGRSRVWEPGTVARLEVATAMAAACPGVEWGVWAATFTRAAVPDPPESGWVLVDDLGDVHYATDLGQLAELLGRGSGGAVARFARTP